MKSRADTNPALFVGLRAMNEHIEIGGVEVRIRKLERNIGIKKCNSHKFRRTMATVAIDKGMSIEQVRKLSGQEKIDRTLHYAMLKQINGRMHTENTWGRWYLMATIGDYFSFQNGYAFKSANFTEKGQYKIVRIKELKDGSIKFFADTVQINPYDNFDVDKYIIRKGDVLFALTGDPVNKSNPLSWVGRVSYYNHNEPALLNQRVCKAVPKANVSSEFLYYFFRQDHEFYNLASKATGSASQANISTKTIEQHNIDIPDEITMDKIVSILSGIDKKIEINEAINRNLEDQIKTIFNSWFYDMAAFGGKEPEGTKYINLEELCAVVTKGTTPTTLGMPFTDQGVNFIKGETILGNHGFDRTKLSFVSEDTHEKLKRSQIESGDIVFTIAGTLGRFALVDDSIIPANTNQAVAIIRANQVSPEYLYSFFIGNWHNDYYTKRIQQAVQANLSLATIKSLPIMILPKDLYEQYLEIITPLIIGTKRIEEENLKLAELRDSLLPKLISGELDVYNLKI